MRLTSARAINERVATKHSVYEGSRRLPRAKLGSLIDVLRDDGRRVLGPTVRDGAVVYDEIEADADLPIGWTDDQRPGRYRLERRDDSMVFGYAVGPHSWKRHFLVPTERLFRARRDGGRVRFMPEPVERPRLALFGARSCDLHALEIQDTILAAGARVDERYAARRSDVFVVAVHCTVSSSSCFCTSMGTGPRVRRGFDLALTEVVRQGEHEFVVDIGSDAGAELADRLCLAPAGDDSRMEAERRVAENARTMTRWLDTTDIQATLLENLEHPRWDDVAGRCLACSNCTMVCPTCFCTTVEDSTDVAGGEAERFRRWDSCFSEDFSYVHGGSVRGSIKSRYRQWLTHKVATWIDQFGRSGCVGCGRCITWCPVGIDITEEVAAIQASVGKRRKS